MNKERRKRLQELKHMLSSLTEEVESVRTDEEQAFESMPEGLQGAPGGEKMQEAIHSHGIGYRRARGGAERFRGGIRLNWTRRAPSLTKY